MATGLLVVQSRPATPEDPAAFQRWFAEVHFPEVLALDGFLSARRLATLDGGSYVAIYEVDDVDTAKAALAAFQSSGAMTPPDGVQLDPPPTVQWLRDLDTTG